MNVPAPATAPKPAASPSVSPSASKPIAATTPPPFTLGTGTSVGRYLKLLAYGKPGSGKTELVASAADVPEMADILMIDAEKGDMTIHDNPRIKNWDKLIENRVPVTSFKQVGSVHDWLVGHCKVRDAYLAGQLAAKQALINNEARLRGCDPSDILEPKLFRTVIIDSLTEVDKYSNYELLGVDEAKVLAGDKDEVDVSGWDEFRKNNQRIQMLLRAFRDLPMHVLVTCGEQYKQDETRKFYYEPNVTGQLSRQVQGFFDIVGFMQVGKVGDKTERRLSVQPVGTFAAKNRRSVYKEDFFANPSMPSIMKGTGLVK